MKWNEIYKPPFKDQCIDGSIDWRSGRIIDSLGNFVFQFVTYDYIGQQKILDILNGIYVKTNDNISFYQENGYVFIKKENISDTIILIRGWGNLTGSGGYNLPSEDAEEVQDTFAEFIVNKLNNKII
jgi:hypothetical protein